MKARIPNANQGGNMMQKIQKMQEEMQKTQASVEESEFTASDFGDNHSYIWFRCESRKLYKKCKITKELNPVEIFIDRTVVKRDLSTNKVNDTVTIEIKKWNYNSNV